MSSADLVVDQRNIGIKKKKMYKGKLSSLDRANLINQGKWSIKLCLGNQNNNKNPLKQRITVPSVQTLPVKVCISATMFKRLQLWEHARHLRWKNKSELLAHTRVHAHSVGRSRTPCHLCSGENMLISAGGGNHSPESSRQGGVMEDLNSSHVRSHRSGIIM